MNITQIENNVQKIIENLNHGTFIYDLLHAFGLPKSSISRLQKGDRNLSKIAGEIIWKKKLYFKQVASEELYQTIATIKAAPELL